jgi:hypothetical protein
MQWDRAASAATRDVLLLVGITLLGYLLVLANPGYFNHDEWQKFDHVEAYGFAHYFGEYAILVVGETFAHPVRPIPFVQQGVSAIFMQSAPLVAHGIDVLLHVLNVVLFHQVLTRTLMPAPQAFAAALLFSLSCLAAFSTGWIGASMDRWYVLFALLAVLGMVQAVRGVWSWRAVCCAAGASAAALLSKETAIVLPGALLIAALALLSVEDFRKAWRRVTAVVVASALPVFAYLWFRWPALEASLALPSGTYSPSIANAPHNFAAYAAYPFMPGALEMVSMSLLPTWQWALALGLHLLLVAAVALVLGARSAILYLAGYVVFLIPVMTVPSIGAHYLYAAGIPLAVVLAMLLVPARRGFRMQLGRALAVSLAVLVVVRGQWVQADLYDQGVCQSRLVAATVPVARHAVENGFSGVHLQPEAGARGYIADRTFFGRPQFSPGGTSAIRIAGESTREDETGVRMAPDCSVILE